MKMEMMRNGNPNLGLCYPSTPHHPFFLVTLSTMEGSFTLCDYCLVLHSIRLQSEELDLPAELVLESHTTDNRDIRKR